jgi:hypothetical protein
MGITSNLGVSGAIRAARMRRVVPRRDIDHVVGTDVELLPVVRDDMHPSRDDRPDVSALTPLPRTIGRMCVDHLHPGSWIVRPTVWSAITTKSTLP